MDIVKRLRKEGAAKFTCQFVDAQGKRCGNPCINSHNIQRKGPLTNIAEKGHVYSLEWSTFSGSFDSDLELNLRGTRIASAFRGFCNRHDNEVFSYIEKERREPDKHGMALLMYRSVCREINWHVLEKVVWQTPQVIERLLAMGLGDLNIAQLSSRLRSLLGLSKLKEKFESMIARPNEQSSFHCLVFYFNQPLPFSYNSAVLIGPMTPRGAVPPDPRKPWPFATAFSGTFAGYNVFAVGGFCTEEQPLIAGYLSQIEEMPLSQVGDFAFNAGIHSTNEIYFRPSWVSGLDGKLRKAILRNRSGRVSLEPRLGANGFFPTKS